jgi:hypothetical protein
MVGLRTMLTLGVIVISGGASAASLGGNYKITLTTTHPSADTASYCLSLVDDGTVLGWQHSGGASISGYIDGEFFAGAHEWVATIGFHGVSFFLRAPMRFGKIGPGSFIAVNDGSIAASGTVTAGAAGSCTPA